MFKDILKWYKWYFLILYYIKQEMGQCVSRPNQTKSKDVKEETSKPFKINDFKLIYICFSTRLLFTQTIS